MTSGPVPLSCAAELECGIEPVALVQAGGTVERVAGAADLPSAADIVRVGNGHVADAFEAVRGRQGACRCPAWPSSNSGFLKPVFSVCLPTAYPPCGGPANRPTEDEIKIPKSVRACALWLRKEAAIKLVESGFSKRKAANLLGVDESTIRADVRENPAESAGKSRRKCAKFAH